MASSSIKTLSMGGNTYSLEDTQAREALSGKVDKVSGRGLSENNYTTAEKNKLAGIAEGATANTGTVTGVKMNGVTKGTSGVVDLGTVITEHQDISGKQNTLVSGTNIRTVNGQSLLGSGNITISGGGESSGVSPDDAVAFCGQEIDVTSNILHYINFASDSARNYVVMNISNGIDTLTLTLDSEVRCEHYVLIDNSVNSEDIAVALHSLQYNGVEVDKMIIPADGISVPAGKYVEISYALVGGSVGVVTCSSVLTD